MAVFGVKDFLMNVSEALRSYRADSTPSTTSAGSPPASFLSSFLRFAGPRAWASLLATLLLGLGEGVGAVMLPPFLWLIGFGGTDGAPGTDRFTLLVGNAFKALGAPMTLPAVLLAYVAVVTVHALARRGQEALDARMINGFIRSLQDRIYAALSRVEWLCFVRMSGPDILRVLTSDVMQVGHASRQLLQLGATGFICAVYAGVALALSPVMTLAAVGCGAAIALALRSRNRLARTSGNARQATEKSMYSAVSEHLGGMKIARSYGLDREHAKGFFAITAANADLRIGLARANAETRLVHQVGAAVVLGAFFFIGAEVAAMSAPALLLMVFVFARLLPRFSVMQQQFQQMANALPAFRSVMATQARLDAAREFPAPGVVKPIRLAGSIRFDRVSFSYDGDSENRVVNEVDFVVPARTTVAIVGPSGSGKTTIADLLMGLLTPAGGEILLDGEPLRGELVHHWRGSIGYVPQETFLFNDTVRANLLWAKRDASEDELLEAVRMAVADAFVSALPQGLDTVLGDRGVRLSGGERQRIALARALLRKPTLLLLDEATSSLDMENERRIQDAIDVLHGELTMVVIAHRLSTIRRADKIVVIEEGRVVETGSWEELSTDSNGRFRALLGRDG